MKPLACQLDVFDHAERRRYETLRERLGERRLGTHELPDGLAILYPGEPDVFLSVAECIRLRLVGGEDLKRFLQSQLKG